MKKVNFNTLKPSFKREALREVQLLKKLKHPHIIKYHNSFVENEFLCIIMEYAERGDLHKLLKESRENKQHFAEDELWLFAL